jgi:DNA-binding beta-propeller fold protein YncE
VDSKGNVYVADYGASLVKVFNASGGFLRSWDQKGSVPSSYPGQFSKPMDVAIDAQGYVYVTDWGNDRVQKFRSDTVFVTTWGSTGSGDGQFNGPRGIAVDASGSVYVADLGNDRVQKFTSNGTFLLKWSVGDNATAPFGIEVEASGNVLVGSIGQPATIKRFSPIGAFLGQVGTPGVGLGFVYEPAAVAVDVNGNVYEAEGNGNRVRYSRFRDLPHRLGPEGSARPASVTTGIAIGPGEDHVSDQYGYRIQKFGHCPPTLQSTWGRLKLYR